jgi:hypothetical protein
MILVFDFERTLPEQSVAQKRQALPVWQRLQTEKSSPPKARLPS